MADPRLEKLAMVLADYSMHVKPGDKVAIYAPVVAAPLAREVYRAVLRAGGHPRARFSACEVSPGFGGFSDGLYEIRLKEGSDEQLRLLPFEEGELANFDAALLIEADENTRAHSEVDPARTARWQQARASFMHSMLERTAKGEFRWCLTAYPTLAHAQDAGLSLSDFTDFVFNAGLLNEPDPVAAWREMGERMRRIAEYLEARDQLRFVAPGTDFNCRVGGRKWVVCAGDMNFPDGEVFSAPVEDSAEGRIRFSYPAVEMGREVEGVELTFRGGKVIEARAERGEDLLRSLIAQDEGASIPGEIAFGMNDGIKRFSRNLLFDEKIGGTMHLALGNAYPEAGGKNKSALHWDMVCDLREGEVFADGQICYRNGKFIV